MKIYTAILAFSQNSLGVVKIKARSLKEAERKADEISPEDVDEWKPIDGEISVTSVREESKS